MAENQHFNPDTAGTFPGSTPLGGETPTQTMAEALRAFPTAVEQLPDGTTRSIHESVGELESSKAALQHRLSREDRVRGLGHVAQIKDEMSQTSPKYTSR